MRWRKSRRLRLLRYVSTSKLERLEDDVISLGSASLSIFGFKISLPKIRSQGIQSRVRRVENALRRQKLLGTFSAPGQFQFLIGELTAYEFIAQGVAIWISSLEDGYVVAGGSAIYFDRNTDTFTSKGIIPGSNPSSYYAGLAAIYRQALDRAGNKLAVRRSAMESWPANVDGGFYHAEADPNRSARSSIWRINPQDEVIATNLDLEEIFRTANLIHRLAADPWRVKVRQLLLVHINHTFENPLPDSYVPVGARLVVGSPLYVEQLTPAGAHE